MQIWKNEKRIFNRRLFLFPIVVMLSMLSLMSLVYTIILFNVVIYVSGLLLRFNKQRTKINYIIYSTDKIQIICIYINTTASTYTQRQIGCYSNNFHPIIIKLLYIYIIFIHKHCLSSRNRQNQPPSNHLRARSIPPNILHQMWGCQPTPRANVPTPLHHNECGCITLYFILQIKFFNILKNQQLILNSS